MGARHAAGPRLDWQPMAKTWVLDTETKGTGAHVVPLEKARRARDRKAELNLVQLRQPTPSGSARVPGRPQRRRFKILDVMIRQTLAEGADLRTALDVLGRVPAIVDVHVYAWDADRRRWRMLDLREQRALWDARPGP